MTDVPSRPASRRPVPPWARYVLVAVGAVLGIVVVLFGAVAILIQTAGLDGFVRAHVVPAWSQKLGRPIALGAIHTGLFPPRAQLSKLVVAGLPGEPPLFAVEQASAKIELWPLVSSFGRDVRVSE